MWRFVTWNVNWWRGDVGRADSERFLAGFDADVVALQEVRGRSWQRAHDGPAVFSQGLYGPATWAWMGCALLLRPGSVILDAGVVSSLPKPQRSVWARVRLPSGDELTAVSWHAPNRAGDGLAMKMARRSRTSDRGSPRRASGSLTSILAAMSRRSPTTSTERSVRAPSSNARTATTPRESRPRRPFSSGAPLTRLGAAVLPRVGGRGGSRCRRRTRRRRAAAGGAPTRSTRAAPAAGPRRRGRWPRRWWPR